MFSADYRKAIISRILFASATVISAVVASAAVNTVPVYAPLERAYASDETAIASASNIITFSDDASISSTLTLSAPILSQPVNTAKGIAVSWRTVPNAETYCLYRKEQYDIWEKIAEMPSDPSPSTRSANSLPSVSYTDPDVDSDTIYYYRVRAKNGVGKSKVLSPYSEKLWCCRLLPPENVSSISLPETRKVTVFWESSDGAAGYRIYRQPKGSSSLELAGEVSGEDTCLFTDTVPLGTPSRFRYRISAVYKTSESVPSAASGYCCYLDSPKIKSMKRTSDKSFRLTWSKSTSANVSGYQIQYSQSKLFGSRKTRKVGSASTSVSLSRLAAKKPYYARVRAYLKTSGKTYYSDWSYSSNTLKTQTAVPKPLKKGDKLLELRSFAKQRMYGYDTLQGSCSDGKYGYFCLHNRTVEKCKIVKVRLSDRKVVKVSKVLSLDHGNDIAYDSKRKRLVVAHVTEHGRRLSVVSPFSLKVISVCSVYVPSTLPGATSAQRKEVGGFAGIAYNKKRDQFVVLLGSSHDFLLLDGNFEPVRFIPASSTANAVYQGIDATDDHILVCASPKTRGQCNTVLSYSWGGTYLGRTNLKGISELEGIFHVGKKFYISEYCSHYRQEPGKGNIYARDNYVYRVSGL